MIELNLLPEELRKKKYWAHVFAMVLLAQFREKEAYQPVVDLFSLPGEISLELTGDFATEYLMRVLASVCCGDITLIEELIENDAVNEFIRSAAIRSLLILVAVDELYREEVIDYFKALYSHKLEKKASLVWCTLTDCCGELHATELAQHIESSFQAGLADPDFVSLDQIKEIFSVDREKILEALPRNPAYHIISDALFELADS